VRKPRSGRRPPTRAPRPGELVAGTEAVPAAAQHVRPCGDCPWRRDALPGWLGSLSARDWLAAAHGEATADCHTLAGPQCAGLAIYRANVLKRPRNPAALTLPADREAVFARPDEFLNHHGDDDTLCTSAAQCDENIARAGKSAIARAAAGHAVDIETALPPCACGGVLYRTRAERSTDRVEVDVVSCSECEYIEEVR
jgi:hypothetical protein